MAAEYRVSACVSGKLSYTDGVKIFHQITEAAEGFERGAADAREAAGVLAAVLVVSVVVALSLAAYAVVRATEVPRM